MAPGQHFVDISLWKPTSAGLEGLSGMCWYIHDPLSFSKFFHSAEELIPTIPDLTALRELTMSPFLRSQIQTASVGSLLLDISTILSGFKPYGVATCWAESVPHCTHTPQHITAALGGIQPCCGLNLCIPQRCSHSAVSVEQRVELQCTVYIYTCKYCCRLWWKCLISYTVYNVHGNVHTVYSLYLIVTCKYVIVTLGMYATMS